MDGATSADITETRKNLLAAADNIAGDWQRMVGEIACENLGQMIPGLPDVNPMQ